MNDYGLAAQRREAVELALQAYRNGADGREDLLDVAKSIHDYIYGEPVVVGETEAPKTEEDNATWPDDGESPRLSASTITVNFPSDLAKALRPELLPDLLKKAFGKEGL